MRTGRVFLIFGLISFMAAVVLAQGKWDWENPKPGGETYSDVFFINDLTGWVVGQKGRILKTADGGLSWTAQQSGTEDDLRNICFLDTQTGFVGGGFNVFKTEDGGAYWQKLALITDGSINALFFISKNKGWVATSNNNIYITEDGGLSWASYYQGSPYSIFSIHFIDEWIGFWLGFGGINKSTDGGKTFRNIFKAPVAWSYNRLSFISPTTAFILGDGGLIAKSTDTGESWTQVYKFVNVNVSSICFKDEQNGCAVGGGIWTTSNGGKIWQKVLDTTGLNDVAFSGLTGYAAGYQGQIWSSKNFGATWSPLHSDFIGFKDLLNIEFNDPQFGLLCGAGGALFRTLDGGLHWTKLDLTLDFWLKDMQIFDSRSACIISNDKIYRFDFTGESWEPAFTATPTNNVINRLFFLNSRIGWIAGRDILYTADGGKSWQVQMPSSQEEHQAIWFTNEQNGFAVGKYEGLYRTDDGGNSWQKQSLPVTVQMAQIKFVNPLIGFCLGRGVILKTIDGGANWQIKHENSKINLIDLLVLDAQHLIAIGGNQSGDGTELATMIYSQDSGESWQNMVQPSTRFLAGGFFLDRNTGWSCGSQATLLKYHDAIALPAAPSALQASIIDTTVQLAWQDASDNEEGFEILRSDEFSGNYQVIDSAAVNTHLFVDRLVHPGTIYWYRIRAYNNQGLSAWTREDSVQTESAPLPPLATPVLLYPGNGDENIILTTALSWQPVPQATSYHLQLAKDSLFTLILQDSADITAPRLYIALENGTTYYWRAAAQNEGKISQWSAAWHFTTFTYVPGAPTLLAPADLSDDVSLPIRFDWQDELYAKTYCLQIATTSTFSSVVIDTVVNQSECTIPYLDQQKVYYWRVNATNYRGSSIWSTLFSFTTFSPYRKWKVQNSGTDNFISSIHFPNYRQGWAAGNNGLILHSQDGGKTWQQQVSSTADHLDDVFFATPTCGWAAGGIRGTMLHTTDGGLKWIQQAFPSTASQRLLALFFADSLKGWVAGTEGFFGTEDGGNTWRLLSQKGSSFYTFQCLTFNTIFADNSTGIVKSIDGGLTWSVLNPGVYCEGICSLDENHLWYATYNGYWNSDDGGQSWQEHADPIRFTDISFIDRKTGFVSAEEKLQMTIDGGLTWKEQSTNLPASATPGSNKMYFCNSPDSLFGWAVGTFGTILRYAAPRGNFCLRPSLITPPSVAANVQTQPIFSWSTALGATGYRIQVTTDAQFMANQVDTIVAATFIQSPALAFEQQYYWRAQALYGDESSLWTFPRRFTTAKKTAVEPAEAFARSYSLLQNYPNPFNATTIVSYALEKTEWVQVILFDLQGRQVLLLENGMKSGGEHKLSLDASGLPAGVYLIRMRIADYNLTRKIAIIK